MKKIKFILLFILSIFIFTGCGSSNFKSISYNELKDKLKDNETFFFVVVKDGCRYCESYEPIVEEVLKENDITAYKLNLSELSEDDFNTFSNEFKVDSTPTTIFSEEGKISLMKRIEGSISKEKLTEKLKDMNYIK